MQFYLVLFAVMLLSLYAGRKRKKGPSNQKEYFLAGRGVTFFPLFLTFLATQVGGGMILGASEEAYTTGISVFLYPLGVALGLIFLGLGVGQKLASLGFTTIAEIFEVKYGSLPLRKIASLLSIFSLFMVLVAQMVASHKFLLSFGLNSTFIYLGFWFLAILYTVKGGMQSVIAADIVQAIFFIAIFSGVFAFTLFSGVTAPLPSLEFTATPKMWGWVLMPLLFMLVEQDMAQRCFAGKSPQVVKQAAITAGIGVWIVAAIPIFFGLLAKVYNIPLIEGSSVLISSIAYFTNPFITALVGVAVILAIISTAVALMNAISSNFSSDFLPNKSVKVSQGITALVALSALIFSFYAKSILGLLIQSYELSVVTIFVPVMMALFRKQPSRKGAIGAMVIGGVSFFFLPPFTYFPKEILSLLLSLIGYLALEPAVKTKSLPIALD